MIDKISVNSVNSSQKQNHKNAPNFKGLTDMILAPIQLCETQPMVNVAVADLATAIIPRTVIEGQTNPYAGLEALRRESSGLIINCMIPGVIVLGIAKVIQGFMMGKGSSMAGCWANEDTIKIVAKYWEDAKGNTEREKVADTIRKILEDTSGADGAQIKSFKGMNFEESIEKLTNNVFSQKLNKKEIKTAIGSIVEQTHIGEKIIIKRAEHIDKKTGKIVNGYFNQSLGDVLENTPKILRELIGGKDVNSFTRRAKNLVIAKSLGGLAVIIPLAIAAQPINRWLTQKSSGKKGAPIYKDFEHTQCKELSSKEKAALFGQKIISVSSMILVAMASIMKMPSWGMLKNITQFKGIFPSMDQARIISTATFSSRMAASQDRNDLREATSRDIATFCTFYFLGDYVAKGVASLIQKVTKGTSKEVTLINVLDKTPEGAGVLKKFWYWAKHTSLKSSAEVYGRTAKATKYAAKMRSVCQLANLGFQLVTLGIIIPKAYRKKTEKEHEKELKQMEMAKKAEKTDKAA